MNWKYVIRELITREFAYEIFLKIKKSKFRIPWHVFLTNEYLGLKTKEQCEKDKSYDRKSKQISIKIHGFDWSTNNLLELLIWNNIFFILEMFLNKNKSSVEINVHLWRLIMAIHHTITIQ